MIAVAGRSVVFYSIIFASVLYQNVSGSGRVQIRLQSYEDKLGRTMNGSCCDGLDTSTNLCRPCDHYIFICLMDVRKHGKGPCISNNITTDTVYATNKITFGSTIGTETNPFSLKFTLPSRYVELQFLTYDDDRQNTSASRPELLQILPYELYRLQPEPFDKVTPFIQVNMSTLQSRLRFEYILQCDEDFYSKCDRFCHPDPVRYRCNNQGRHVCNPGWTDKKDCSTYNFCWNQTCNNGGTCNNGLLDFSCACPDEYTGKVCETVLKESNSTRSTTTNTTEVPKNSNFSTQLGSSQTTANNSIRPKSSRSTTVTEAALILASGTSNSNSSNVSTVEDVLLHPRSHIGSPDTSLTTTIISTTSSTLSTLYKSTRSPSSTSVKHLMTTRVTFTTSTTKTVQTQQVPTHADRIPMFIGIILGAVVGVILLVSIIVYFALHKRKKNKVEADCETDEEQVIEEDHVVVSDEIPLKVQNSLNW